MAIRMIRKDNDEILRKKAKPIEKVDEKIKQLIEDMVDTMHSEEGIGLAANQIGVLKQVIVIDIGEKSLYKLINPEIISSEGESLMVEGCLSVPNVSGEVARPEKIKVKALNENGKEVIINADGLLARVIQHEIDHLKGVLFTDKVKNYVNN